MQTADQDHADVPTAKAALHQAILAAFQADDSNQEAAAGVLTDLAVAFADVLRGEPGAASTELTAHGTPHQVLAELRKQTTLLEVIAKQGEFQLDYISSASDPVRVTDLGGLPG